MSGVVFIAMPFDYIPDKAEGLSINFFFVTLPIKVLAALSRGT